MKEEFNGYHFDDKKMRKRMKYLVIFEGDLDLNGAYAFENKKELKKHLKGYSFKKIYAIFQIKDLTNSI